MIKTISTIFLFIFLTLSIHAENPVTNEKKVTLTYLEVKDKAIQFVATDINAMIMRKNKGFMWPVTKITFYTEGEKLLFDVTAIDNSWCNMITEGENPYGFFTENQRIFVVSTRGEASSIDLAQYFDMYCSKTRTFVIPNSNPKSSENPKWHYHHKGHMASVVNSVNIGKLGK